jgi:hypothetical protein
VVVAGLVLAPAAPVAEAADDAASTEAPAPTTRCTLQDPRLPEVSGLVDLGDRLVAMNDGGDQVSLYVLDSSCAVVDVRTAAVDPYDPEDLALGADGTLWLADTGDNNQDRETVALIGLRPDGSSEVDRYVYPDGAHDTEALLLAPDGTPYLVTKEVLGASRVYRPSAPGGPGATVPLTHVADVGLTLTGTPGGPVGRAGQLMVTGGAVSPDGTLLALRTYTDAYVWRLSGSDVVGALAGQRVRVPLPEEPQGEAISFTADSRSLVVGGEGLPTDVSTVPLGDLLAPAAATTTPKAPTSAPASGSDPSPVAAALVAAALATGLVWLFGRLRRRD